MKDGDAPHKTITLDDLEASATPDLDALVQAILDQPTAPPVEESAPEEPWVPGLYNTREDALKALQQAMNDRLLALPAEEPIARPSTGPIILDILLEEHPQRARAGGAIHGKSARPN